LLYPIQNQKSTYSQLNSKFYSFLYKVSSIDEVKFYLKVLKEKFPDASHICYAYRLFDGFTILNDINTSDFSADAGEPRGSAGPPILKILKKFKMINSSIFVVRYFGGKKLGIPGLIEAYSKSSELVIDSENMKEWFPTTDIKLYYPYSIENKMNNLFSIFDITIKKQEFKESIYSVIQLNQFKMNDFMDKIRNFPDCKVYYNKN
tara:strand:- start:69 stop:683 length:615 start_codon:yes stop_codon:yes gene_type:complete